MLGHGKIHACCFVGKYYNCICKCMYSKVAHFLKKKQFHESPFYNVIFYFIFGIMGSMVIMSMYQKQ